MMREVTQEHPDGEGSETRKERKPVQDVVVTQSPSKEAVESTPQS